MGRGKGQRRRNQERRKRKTTTAAAQRPGQKAELHTGSKRPVTPEPDVTTNVKGHVGWTQKGTPRTQGGLMLSAT